MDLLAQINWYFSIFFTELLDKNKNLTSKIWIFKNYLIETNLYSQLPFFLNEAFTQFKVSSSYHTSVFNFFFLANLLSVDEKLIQSLEGNINSGWTDWYDIETEIGKLTFVFTSDGSGRYEGFDISRISFRVNALYYRQDTTTAHCEQNSPEQDG